MRKLNGHVAGGIADAKSSMNGPPLPPTTMGAALSAAPRTVSSLGGENDSDEEDLQEMAALLQSSRQIQQLRAKNEVSALASSYEEEISDLFGGDIIGRVVVVNEVGNS